ncbi:MAG: hypothetical protein WC707_07055 [Candidatus Babeliaceae bacterium]|jgi:hypothetical protein
MPIYKPNGTKQQYLDRLKDWQDELSTNKHGMQEYAEQVILLCKDQIDYYWPELLN